MISWYNRYVYWFQSAPPAKGAIPAPSSLNKPYLFQSAPPAKGAISIGYSSPLSQSVSIRAPREGGDPRN